MAKRGIEREKIAGIDLGKLVNSAVSEGIGAISETHPRFDENFLREYLDKRALTQYAAKMAQSIKGYQGKKSPEELVEEAYKTLASHVASGEFFNEKGKEIILNQGWQKKAKRWFGSRTAKEILRGEEYLDKTLSAFKDLYNLMKSGDYARRMPELADAITAVYDAGFKDASINVLYANGLMDENKYKVIKRSIRETAERGVKQTQKALESYFSQNLAATILALVGLGVLVTTARITGNVINLTNSANNLTLPALFFGVVSLISGIYLWLRKK